MTYSIYKLHNELLNCVMIERSRREGDRKVVWERIPKCLPRHEGACQTCLGFKMLLNFGIENNVTLLKSKKGYDDKDEKASKTV